MVEQRRVEQADHEPEVGVFHGVAVSSAGSSLVGHRYRTLSDIVGRGLRG
jgi:hypothetical protein